MGKQDMQNVIRVMYVNVCNTHNVHNVCTTYKLANCKLTNLQIEQVLGRFSDLGYNHPSLPIRHSEQ